MTYLVTGASGFIGSYVVGQLLDEGERVVGFDRSWPGSIEMVLGDAGRDLVQVHGDVSDYPSLANVVREHDVTHVIHLAAELHARSASNPGQCLSSNVDGTHHALELARLFPIEKVITASSAAIFGPPDRHPDGRVTNDARQYANDLYEATKIFGESAGEFYSKEFGVDTTAIRVGLAYGYGCLLGNGRHIIDQLLERPMRGESTHVQWGDGSLNWTYVVDAAAAFIAASRAPRHATFGYNLRGDYRRISDAVDIARDLLPGADITAEPGNHHWAQDFDDEALATEVGFRSSWDLEAGLADTLARLQAHR